MFIEERNFASPEEMAWISENIEKHFHLQEGSYQNREGMTIHVGHHKELKHIDDFLFKIFDRAFTDVIQPAYKPKHGSSDTGYEFHRYPPGSICKEHVDGEIFYEDPTAISSAIRYATVVLHLTTNESELVFEKQNTRIKTEAGKLVVFPPSTIFPHYTTKSKSDRDVIVTWFTYTGVTATKTK